MTDEHAYRSLAELQRGLESGEYTCVELVDHSLARIAALDRTGPELRAVIEVNPDAGEIGAGLDRERAGGHLRGPLHGVPLLVKDNLDTADKMATSAGSLALAGVTAAQDSGVAARLRAAGAVILGKTNLSEWANFRSTHSSSGWSARGGQCRNPYVLDRSPCGSSSGSGAAVAAGYSPFAAGTETSGSILCPAAACNLVGIKPTVGLTSRAGVIPIAHSQDVVGPMARSVADAALLLSLMAGPDPRDPATLAAPASLDLLGGLRPDGLRGARIGVARRTFTGYSPKADRVFEEALERLRAGGAELVDPADIPSIQEIERSSDMLKVLLHEFKAGLNTYLGQLAPDAPVHSLQEVIEFNRRHAAEEMPYFGQERMEQAEACGPLTDADYLAARARCRRLAGAEGIDAVLQRERLEALVMPTTGPMWPIDLVNGDAAMGGSAGPAAMAGYPAITVPMGMVQNLPLGLTFMGSAWTEPTLIRLAYAFEQAGPAWQPPRFLPTVGN